MTKSASEVQAEIVSKTTTDAQFRQQFIADPKGVINQEFGIEIPDNMQIHVHEGDLQNVHIALPPPTVMTEEQLEAISAGLCCCGA